MSQQQFCFTVAVKRRRRIGMLVLAFSIARPVDSPDFFAGCALKSYHTRFASLRISFTMNQLNIKYAAVQHRGRTHTKLNTEFAVPILQIELPDFCSVDGVTSQCAV